MITALSINELQRIGLGGVMITRKNVFLWLRVASHQFEEYQPFLLQNNGS